MVDHGSDQGFQRLSVPIFDESNLKKRFEFEMPKAKSVYSLEHEESIKYKRAN